MVWLIIIVIATLVLGLLVEPFFRAQKPSTNLDELDYLAAQIEDVARDQKAGLISDESAAVAETEARRRLLAADRIAKKRTPHATGFAARQASTMLIAAAPLAAVALYLAIGNPNLNSTPAAQQIAAKASVAPSAENARPLSESIATVEQRLAENPDNIDDWVLLADSYARLERFAEAAVAFGRARALEPNDAFLHAAEGEALAMSSGGTIIPAARDAFEQALKIDPSEPRARFYLAIGAYQAGEREAALDALVSLANGAPASAQWLPIVRSQIELIAGELKRPLDTIGLEVATDDAGPSAAALEAEIAGGDAPYETWMALIDAYATAGDMTRARDALARAKTRYANAPFVLQQLAAAEAQLGTGEPAPTTRGPTTDQMQAAASMSPEDRTAMIEGMVAGLAARLEGEPDDIEGWTMLARSYGVLDQPEKSAAAYERAIELAPDDLALRVGRAQSLLARLEAETDPVDAETQQALRDITRLNPDHPFALYFLGLAARNDEDTKTAREVWTRLVATLPAGSPDAARIQAMINAL